MKRTPVKTSTKTTPPELAIIQLPKPRFGKGKSLASALKARKTQREVSSRKLPMQTLSNLLWAACGMNRKAVPFGIGGRTAATASNSQEIDVYVAMQEGTYLYDPREHRLLPVAAGDLRAAAIGRGQAGAGSNAPVRLIYVADIDKLANTAGFQEPGLRDPEVQKSYYYADTGMIAGNVYLFASAYGLAAWFHNCDRQRISSKLRLGGGQRPLFGQTVGYPKGKE